MSLELDVKLGTVSMHNQSVGLGPRLNNSILHRNKVGCVKHESIVLENLCPGWKCLDVTAGKRGILLLIPVKECFELKNISFGFPEPLRKGLPLLQAAADRTVVRVESLSTPYCCDLLLLMMSELSVVKTEKVDP
ncbi:hypothetical protein IFR05_007901 [Cadophora sp. M221]|nr:hypothetical protein IFR05_007901 [Cadophora sp. M221]